VDETVIANKVKLGAAEALALAKTVKRVIAARGKQVQTLEVKKGGASDDDLLAVLLGPTGNLRAPAAVVGDTLVVGFSPEVYAEVLGHTS
jgi:arsenate reductase-like glutaredoxin family protein